ncbi:MAG: putative acyl esterase [Kiritimatiellia bacterium]|jgi:predicted acyl esterase
MNAELVRHKVTEVDGLVRHEVVYGSDGMRIYGMAVVPAEPGPWPVLLFNHGGFSGIGDRERLDDMVRSGAAVFASEYRGEGKSQGEIECCAGEVDDVVRFAEVAESIDNVDTSAIVSIGFSHGACISLFLRDQLPALRGTVTMGTPAEIAVHIQWHRDKGNDAFADRWASYVGDDVLVSEDPAAAGGVVLGIYQDVEHAPNTTVWDSALEQAHSWLR